MCSYETKRFVQLSSVWNKQFLNRTVFICIQATGGFSLQVTWKMKITRGSELVCVHSSRKTCNFSVHVQETKFYTILSPTMLFHKSFDVESVQEKLATFLCSFRNELRLWISNSYNFNSHRCYFTRVSKSFEVESVQGKLTTFLCSFRNELRLWISNLYSFNSHRCYFTRVSKSFEVESVQGKLATFLCSFRNELQLWISNLYSFITHRCYF